MNLNVDWILAMTIFLLLVAWSFIYYSGLFEQVSEPVAGAADTITNTITDFLEIDTYDVIVKHNSTYPFSDVVLYLNLTWPEGTQNSTQVYLGTLLGNNLTCNITDNILYWKSDLVTGANYFLVHFSNRSMDLNCTSTKAQVDIYDTNSNQTVAWAMVKKRLISQAKVDMFDPGHASYYDYTSFRNNTGIERDFRVIVYNSTSNATYGPSPPLMTNVYVRERWNKIEETNKKANITVMVW